MDAADERAKLTKLFALAMPPLEQVVYNRSVVHRSATPAPQPQCCQLLRVGILVDLGEGAASKLGKLGRGVRVRVARESCR